MNRLRDALRTLASRSTRPQPAIAAVALVLIDAPMLRTVPGSGASLAVLRME